MPYKTKVVDGFVAVDVISQLLSFIVSPRWKNVTIKKIHSTAHKRGELYATNLDALNNLKNVSEQKTTTMQYNVIAKSICKAVRLITTLMRN